MAPWITPWENSENVKNTQSHNVKEKINKFWICTFVRIHEIWMGSHFAYVPPFHQILWKSNQ